MTRMLFYPQLRKEVSSSSAAQTGGSHAPLTPADSPCPPESVEGEEGGLEIKAGEEVVEEEEDDEAAAATKGASLTQETTAKQDVCG